jgi:hypothetical protein
MTRLSLQVVYLWRHVSSTAPPFILWWSNLELLFVPLHRSSPFIGELRCQAIHMEHGLIVAREKLPKTKESSAIAMDRPNCVWEVWEYGLCVVIMSGKRQVVWSNKPQTICPGILLSRQGQTRGQHLSTYSLLLFLIRNWDDSKRDYSNGYMIRVPMLQESCVCV